MVVRDCTVSHYAPHFKRGATTVVFVVDREAYLSLVRKIVHKKRADNNAADAQTTPAMPGENDEPLRGKTLGAPLGNKAFKRAVISGIVNALQDWAADNLLDNQVLVLDTLGDQEPVVLTSRGQDETEYYIKKLRQRHDKGEADYAMFMWALRTREPNNVLIFTPMTLTSSSIPLHWQTLERCQRNVFYWTEEKQANLPL